MRKFKYVFIVALLQLATRAAAQVGGNPGTEILRETQDALTGLTDNLVSLLQVIIGLGALGSLVIVVYKMINGDREAAQKIAWWLAGFVLGFVLLSVVRNVIA